MNHKRTLKRLASNFICIVTALSLMFLQTPVSYAVDADEAQDTALTQVTGESSSSSAEASGEDTAVAQAESPEAAQTDASIQQEAEPAGAGAPADEAAKSEKAAGEDATDKESVADDKEADEQKPDTKRVYEFEDDQLKVIATLEAASAIPDEAELKVTAITADSADYNYDAYMEALNRDAGQGETYTAKNTLLYDVAFLIADGDGKVTEVQPEEGAVQVKFAFKRDQLAELLGNRDATDVNIVHLPLKEEVREAYETTSDATDISATDVEVDAIAESKMSVTSTADEAEFKTTSFSGVAFTVPEDEPEFEDEYTVTVNFYDYDGTSAVPYQYSPEKGDAPDNTIYLYAELRNADGEAIGWTKKELRPGSASTVTETLTKFGSVSNAGWVDDSLTYDPSVHMVSVRLYRTDPTYHLVRESLSDWEKRPDDTINGYKFLSNKTSGSTTTVNLKRWNGSHLYLNFNFDEPLAQAVSEGDNYWIRVELKHQSGSNTYFIKKLSDILNAQNVDSFTVEADEWRDNQNGNVIAHEKFTGGEPSVSAQIIHTSKSANESNIVKLENMCEIIAEGGNMKNYAVSYVDGEKPVNGNTVDDEAAHESDLYYTIEFERLRTSGALTPADILGDAVDYGIIANRYDQFGHSETNMAVNYLFDLENIDIDGSGTAPIPFYVAYIVNQAETGQTGNSQLDISAGTRVPSDVFVGEGSEGKVVKEHGDRVVKIYPMPEADIESYVNGLIAAGRNSSQALASQTTIAPVSTQQGYTVDTTAFPDNTTIYVNADGISEVIKQDGWKINKLPGQSIVFNISKTESAAGDGKVTISEFWVDPNDGGEPVKSTTYAFNNPEDEPKNKRVDSVIFEHISFNVVNATEVHLNNVSGLFLLPQAEHVTQSNGAGWILAKGTVESHAEWHFFRFNRDYKAKGDMTLQVKKGLVDAAGAEVPYESKNFRFAIYKDDGNGNPDGDPIELARASADAGIASFKSLAYSEDTVPDGKTEYFKYVVVEVVPDTAVNQSGVSYADATAEQKANDIFYKDGVQFTGASQPIRVTVAVTNRGDEDLEISVVADDKDITGTDDKVFEVGAVTNTVTGMLKVEKTVVSNVVADKSKQFEFTVTLSDTSISGTYGDMEFQNGVAKLQLKHGASATAVDLPTGITYTVEEESYDEFAQTATDADGTVTHEGSTVSFTNTRMNEGSLTVSKKVMYGTKDDRKRDFHFKVTLDKISGTFGDVAFKDNTATVTPKPGETITASGLPDHLWYKVESNPVITGTYGDLEFDENGVAEFEATDSSISFAEDLPKGITYTITVAVKGKHGDMTFKVNDKGVSVAEFTLKHGQVKTAADLPLGLGYTVEETDSEGFELTTTGATGTITKNSTAAFTNTKQDESYEAKGSISFEGTKSIDTREMMDGDKYEFTMTGTFTNKAGETLDEISKTFSNDTKGPIHYPTIKYVKNDTHDDTGTHVYTVSEVAYDKDGVKSSSKEYTVTVVVSDDGDGTLEIQTSGDDPKHLDFVNTYDAIGHGTVGGTKVLEGRELADGDTWTFTLTGADGAPIHVMEGDKLVDKDELTTTNVKGEFSFDDLYFTLADLKDGVEYAESRDFTYTISESGEVADVTNDTPKEVTVTVSQKKDNKGRPTGELDVSVSKPASEVVFTNTYAAAGSITIKGKKSIDVGTRNDLSAFKFNLKGNGVDQTVNANVDGSFAFSALSYEVGKDGVEANATKTFEYTLSEVDTPAGYTAFDPVTVKVTVTDDGTGALKVTSDMPEGGYALVNKHEATGSVTFAGTKSMEGRELAEGDEFTFEILENGKVIAEAHNDATGKIDYPTISYELNAGKDDTGTHTYTVREAAVDADTGVAKDTREYTVTVAVTDQGTDELKVEPSENYQKLDFTNAYDAIGHGTVGGTKVLEGRALADGDKWTFTLAGKDGAPIHVMEGGELADKDELTTQNNGADFSFGDLYFTLDDLKDGAGYADSKAFTYTVAESGEVAGVENDATASKTVTLTVTQEKDGKGRPTGELGVSVSEPASGLVFTNRYSASATLDLAGTKTIDKRDIAAGDTFTFEVKEGETVVSTGTAKGGGTIAYTPISYEYDGTDATKGVFGEHHYVVSETAVSAAGVTKSSQTHALTTKVSDKGDGTLDVQVAEGDASKLDFVNTYKATGSITFGGTKSIDKRALKDGDAFEFEVKEGGETVATGASDATGKIAYSSISYELSAGKDDTGEHEYVVSEVAYDKNGVKSASTTHTVKVKVSDNGDGTLDVQVTEGDKDALDFINAYTASGSITFKGAKAIEGRGFNDGETFSFPVVDKATGETVATGVSNDKGEIVFPAISYDVDCLVDAGGNYLDRAEYTYVVSETPTTAGGITPDSKTYEVAVVVKDNGDGTLSVTSSDDYEKLDFTNTYAAAGKVVLGVQKGLYGTAGNVVAIPEGKTFDFLLSEVTDDPDAEPQAIDDATTDENGKAQFGELSYTSEGAHTYQVAEKLPAGATQITDPADPDNQYLYVLDDVIYDTTPHEVKVELSDENKTGALAVKVTYGGEDVTADAATGVFMLDATNTSLTAKADVQFEKYLFGEAAFNEFTFSLVALDAGAAAGGDYSAIRGESEAADPMTDSSDGTKFIVDDGVTPFTLHSQITPADIKDGRADIPFAQIRYLHDGTYYYRVQEEAPNASDADMVITPDEAQFAIAVTVEDGAVTDTTYRLLYPNEEGVLEDLGETDELAFYNNAAAAFDEVPTYGYVEEGAQTSVYPRAKKDVNGNTAQLRAGEYTFELLDEAGEVLATAANDENGDVSFFDESAEPGLVFDAPGDYTYQIREVAGNAPGVTYDTNVVLLTVSVEEVAQTVAGDENAYHLEASVTYDNPSNASNTAYAEFHNTKQGVDLKVRKTSADDGAGLAGCVYTLWMKDASGDVMIADAESDADGWITFEDVSLLEGYQYYFKEASAPSGHMLNPYRSDYFELAELEGGAELVAPFDVVDEVTRVEVAKLDAGTHDYLPGAKLRIVDEDTGAVMDEWTSGKGIHELTKALDVDTVYILEEVEAPKGYATAEEVRFRLNETAGAGIEVLSGTKTTLNGSTVTNAEKAGDYGINLYNSGAETVVHKNREVTRSGAPQTGDQAPILLAAAAALLALLAALTARRRLRNE